MSKPVRWLAVAWVVIALLLNVGSSQGGDTAVISTWLELVWTLPFGVLWWTYGYDCALHFLPKQSAQLVGTVVVDLLAFTFWFVAIPWVRAHLLRRWPNT